MGKAATITLALGLLAPATVMAQSVDEFAKRLIKLRGEVEQIHDDIEGIQQNHRNRMTSLSQREAELEAQIQRQKLQLKQLNKTLADLQKETRDATQDAQTLLPIVQKTVSSLGTHVEGGLPFKIDNRKSNVELILSKLEKGELTTPRAINELWTFIEDEFRLTRENTMLNQDQIVIGGKQQLADVIRIGMVIMYFRTTEESYGFAQNNGGTWNFAFATPEASKKIEDLFLSFEKQIRSGFFEIPNPSVTTNGAAQ